MTAYPTTAFLQTLTVLYLEEDPGVRAEIAGFLEDRVGRLLLAVDGDQALAAFHAGRPDLLIVGTWAMEGDGVRAQAQDGLGLVRAIRERDCGTPIILTPAVEHAEDLLGSLELDIDRYVLKPIQPQRLEAALAWCARRLMSKAQQRTRPKGETRILKMRHQAQQRTLLEGIAHDYNNLLHGILTAHDLALALSPAGSPVRQVLDTARPSVEQARLLSQRLHALLHSPERPDRVAPIEGLLRGAAEQALSGSPIQPVFDFQGGDPAVHHHGEALPRVISCLVANAREAMPAGGTLRLASAPCSCPDPSHLGLAPGAYLHVEVQDDGRGIAAEDLPRIFEPYFTTKPRGNQRGTGLGLALCEAIVNAHGGCIRAESEAGRGARFQIHLPLP